MKQKKIWIPVAVLAVLIAGYGIFATKKKLQYKTAYVVAPQEVRQTVLATGTVTSSSNLNLSFKNSGRLAKVNVIVGDRVRIGQVLAELDQKDANASVNQSRAAVLAAKANYDKVVNGASSAEVNVAKTAVDSARVALNNAKLNYTSVKLQQDTLVANAYLTLLNSGIAAIAGPNNVSTAIVTISGSYTSTVSGQYRITSGVSGAGYTWDVSGLETDNGVTTRGSAQPFGKRGLFLSFSSTGTINPNDYWIVSIPNTQAANYLANNNAYLSAQQTEAAALQTAQSAIDSAQAALDSANAQLTLKQTAARPEDIEAALAQVQTAQAQLQAAQNTISSNIITAPIDGTITSVDAKVGEDIAPEKEALVLLNQNSLHVESDIPESSIADIKVGQQIDMTFDAFGPGKHFSGEVISIDPASSVVQGVINYRVISSLPNDSTIRPGMSANVTIILNDKQVDVAVPNRLIKSNGSQKYVTILRGVNAVDVNIEVGQAGDSYTEVINGLNIGDTLVTSLTQP